jgi:HK97 gp10 family phage protein
MGRIPPQVKKRINQANEKSAEELAAMMVRLAPIDEGDLIRSIRYYELATTAGGGVTWRVSAGNETAYYSRFVEFGNGITPARPFFYPAYRALRRLIRNRQLRAFRQALKETRK